MIKYLLKLFNETNKNDKNCVLSVLYDILPKRILKKKGFVFSNFIYKTAKKSILALKKKLKQLFKQQKNTKKSKMS